MNTDVDWWVMPRLRQGSPCSSDRCGMPPVLVSATNFYIADSWARPATPSEASARVLA